MYLGSQVKKYFQNEVINYVNVLLIKMKIIGDLGQISFDEKWRTKA